VSYEESTSLSMITEHTDKEIETINVESGFIRISHNAFSKCKPVYHINIPDTVEYFGNNVFYNLSIKTLHLPKNFKEYDPDQPFDWCLTLKEFTIDDENQNFSVQDGVLFSKDKTVLYMYPNGKEDISYTVPYGVEYIYNAAFAQNSFLKHLFIPETVVSSRNILYKTNSNPTVTVLKCPCENIMDSIGYTYNSDTVYNLTQMKFISGYNETMSSDGKTLIISPLSNGGVQYTDIDFDDISFAGDRNINTVVFEKGITKISQESFASCSGIKHIVFLDNIESINHSTFANIRLRYNSIVYQHKSLGLLSQYFSPLALGLVSPTNTCNTHRNHLWYFIQVILS